MTESFYVVPVETHNALVRSAYRHRGFSESECDYAARLGELASWHGVRTHNAIKASHLDHLFGSGSGGCQPVAEIEKIPTRFSASEIWNANRKLGQAVGFQAMEKCIELADLYGVGMVSVDNAFHYLWGGGYVMEVAKRGYIGYTNCTAALAEVVPFLGKKPTMGTNPHSWSFPTVEAVGFPIVVDWATSVVSMGRVQQFAREGLPLPPGAALDSKGDPTIDPSRAAALLPFGAHKGYGLCLMNELLAALIGGSLPTLRSHWSNDGEKHTPCFFFQVIHPEALNGGAFGLGRSQKDNVKAVIEDILGDDNRSCMLPGQVEAEAAERSKSNNGLLFSKAELDAFGEIAIECGKTPWSTDQFCIAD